jgi:TetR/AcrR family transcriptional regulator, transcriptional repressor of bet genes
MEEQRPLVYAATAEDIAFRRRTILDHASRVVARTGVAGCSLAAVARSSGHSIGMIQHYFGKRDTLVQECIRFRSEAAVEEWSRIAEQAGDPIQVLHALLSFAVEGDEPFEDGWGFWLQIYAGAHIDPDIRATVGEALESWRASFVTTIERARAAGVVGEVDAERVATYVVALTDGLAVQALTDLYHSDPATMRTYLYEFTADQLGIEPTAFAREARAVRARPGGPAHPSPSPRSSDGGTP